MLRAFIVIVGFVAIGLSTMAIPFVLSGVVDAAVPFEALLTLFSVLVVAGTAILVLSEISSGAARLYRAIRSRRVSRRKAVSVVCWAVLGGTVVTSWLGYFSLSPLRYAALPTLALVLTLTLTLTLTPTLALTPTLTLTLSQTLTLTLTLGP